MTLWMAVALLVMIAGMAFMSMWKSKDPSEVKPIEPEGSSLEFRRRGILDADASSFLLPPPAPEDSIPCFLVIDTETTGLPEDEAAFIDGSDAPAPVSIGWQLLDFKFRCIEEKVYHLHPSQPITPEAAALHGDLPVEEYHAPREVYMELLQAVSSVKVISAHNLAFHRAVLVYDMRRWGIPPDLLFRPDSYCTMEMGIDFTHIHAAKGSWKLPRLTELFGVLYFGRPGVRTTYREKARNDIRLVAACLRRMNPTTPAMD